MTNNDFIDNFFANCLPSHACQNHLMKVDDTLYNYSTEIVKIDRLNKIIYFNVKKYSRTTSKIQSHIRYVIEYHFSNYEVKEYVGNDCCYWNYGFQGAENWTKSDMRKYGYI